MSVDLIKIRVIALLQDLKALILSSLLAWAIAFLASPDLMALLEKYFGAAIAGMVVKIAVGAAIDSLRNIKIVRDAEQVGGYNPRTSEPLL
jgi:hypothetical protein